MNFNQFRVKIWLLAGLFSLLFIFVLIRLIDLQIFNRTFYKKMSLQQRSRLVILPAPRGDIFDRKGKILATSISLDSSYMVPQRIKKEDIPKIAAVVGESTIWLKRKLKTDLPFVWLKRKMNPPVARKLRKAQFRGVGFLAEKKRIYPKSELAASVLGFAGIDNQGLAGVELSFDRYLKGKAGRIVIEADPLGQRIATSPGRELEAPTIGKNITLTIDEFVQYFTEKELKQAVEKYQAKRGMAVVLDPKTGEILAMADYPDFNPNRYFLYAQSLWNNDVIGRIYEPGSTFKPLTVAAGLEEGIISATTRMYCPEEITLGDRTIKNSSAFAEEEATQKFTLGQILAQSINTGAAQIGMGLGKERLMKYVRAFGFGRSTGIELPGEVAGIVRPTADWSAADVGVIPFGQGIAVTSLQLTMAISVLANDGVMVKPHIVKKVSDKESGGSRRVISVFVARALKEMMQEVITDGLGNQAAIRYYTVAGKTGTAQKVAPGGKGYLKKRYISSFIGFAPVKNPRLVCLIVVDDPALAYGGSVIAAPAFKKIMEKTLRYLDVPPDKG